MPYRPIHAQLLPTGKVLFWDSYANADFPQLWDPSTGTIAPAAQVGYNIFCTGFSLLADGRMLLVGGHVSDNVGLAYTSRYDPLANAWTRLPNMNAGRWYPSATTLANGDILALSGMIDTSTGANLMPQVWQAATGAWRDLTGAQLQMPYYPYLFVAPDGRVFAAGPAQTTRLLDTSGTGGWTVVGDNTYGTRNWGSAVLYDAGKVLIMGGTKEAFYAGSSNPTNTAEVIDLTSAAPAWKPAASMAFARKQHNATLLPDGEVLVTGGSSGTETATANSTKPALAAELWNPATGAWTRLASDTVFRGYHSIAMLLPDGRVLSGGGNFDASLELFSPPYLFNGARPTIASAPSFVGYGQTFFVGTADAATVAKAAWLRLASVTHTNNMGQRRNVLSFTQTAGGLNVTAPANAVACPPGYYMLFLLNGAGVPSVAAIVRIGPGAPTPTRTPTRPPTSTPTAASPPATATRTPTPAAPTSTRVSTATPTAAASATPSRTPTRTPTATATAPAEPSATRTRTPLATGTPTRTATFTPTRTGTVAPSPTSSPAATKLPAAPSSLTVKAFSSTRIDLNWHDNSTNESGFSIERCMGDKATCTAFSQIAQVAVNVNTYADTTVSPATTYTYRVRAFNALGFSGYSNKENATTPTGGVAGTATPTRTATSSRTPTRTPTLGPPAAPSGLTAKAASRTQINLNWHDNSTNESGFRIERCLGPKATCLLFLQIGQVGVNVQNYSDTTVTPATKYTYRVRAFNALGTSPYSGSVEVTTPK